MATEGGDDGDDNDINLLTALFPDDIAEVQDETTMVAADSETSHQLQHHYLSSIDSSVAIRQLRSLGLSFQLWPAATVFVALLDCHLSQPSTSPLAPTLSALAGTASGRRRLRILELGSGTGLVGIAAAATLGAEVTVTDLPRVLPNLQFNVDANSKLVAEHGGSMDVAPLSWGQDDQMEAIGRDYDLMVGSDVVYHDHLFDPLLRTLKFFMVGREGKMVFVMAHLRRWKKESAFFKKAKKVFDVEVIHVDDPSSGSRVGVVVYRFAAKRQNSAGMASDN